MERLDVGPTGDIIYIYVHRGGIVGGKEVIKVTKKLVLS